jgi:HEAT repeat protein
LYAADALGSIGDTRAVGPLNESLNDEDERVRSAAAKALEKIRAE